MRKRYPTPFETIPRCSAHGVFPEENNGGITAEFMLLPLDFQLHVRRRWPGDLDNVPDGESGLGRNPRELHTEFRPRTLDTPTHRVPVLVERRYSQNSSILTLTKQSMFVGENECAGIYLNP